ncbi:hypothetical protein NMY22_g10525 [Coprinellus aureogranulatus]|nr:hypothetical protein NMY22_g10525 [Coprinellus aureogranulatus]
MRYAADMLTKGANGARSDDVKSLKSAVIDWITPAGGVLTPNIPRNNKDARGFFHDVTGRYLCPTDYDWDEAKVRQDLRAGRLIATGLQWPNFLYAGLKCNQEDMWEGLFRSRILIQAFKHIFISPSSVDGQSRATRSGNAYMHGMESVTAPSIAYVATLVRFSLSSASTFSRSDTTTDSQRFYNTIVDFLEMEEEEESVSDLLAWWNQQIFPTQSNVGFHTVPKTSALARLKAQRQERRRQTLEAITNLNAPASGPQHAPTSGARIIRGFSQ